MAKLSEKPEWTTDLPDGASIVAIIEGQLYRLGNSLFIGPQGPQGEKGDKGDTGAAGADGADGADGAPETSTLYHIPVVDGVLSATTTTLSDITPFNIDLDANSIYTLEFVFHLDYGSGGVHLETKYTGTLLAQYMQGIGIYPGPALEPYVFQDTSSQKLLLNSASGLDGWFGTTSLVTDTAGTFSWQWATSTGVGTVVLRAGSFVRFKKVGSAT